MTYGAVPYGSGPYGASQGAAATASGFPIVALAIAFDSPPGAEVPVWTDVSADLELAKTRRGRSRELERYQPGEAEFVLANADRKYDPVYASSPYFGKILPMKRLRLEATYGGVTYPIYDGFIDSWEQVYEHPQEALAVVKATDAFKVLAGVDLPSSAYASEIQADSPVGWWRLGDSASSTVATDSAGSADLTMTGDGVTFGQTSLVARDADTACKFIDDGLGEEDGFQRYGPALVTTAPLTFEMIYQFVGPGTDGLLGGHVSGFAGAGIAMGINGTTVSAAFSLGLVFSVTLSAVVASINDGSAHHLAAVWESGGTLCLYVDGAQVQTGTLAALSLPANAYMVIGGGEFAHDETMDCVLDEVALYATALSAAQVAAHRDAMTTPWDGDSPGERAERILDTIAWPAVLRELDNGKSTLQSAILGTTALEHLQKVAESEFGALFITRDGKVRLVGREQLMNRASLATFGDGTGEVEYTELDFDYSDTDIRNEVTVSRNEGVAQRVEDAASIAAFLRHSWSIDGLFHDDDTVSRAAANLILSQYAQPALRVTQLRMDPITAQPTLFLEALERELTDPVTVRRRPQNLGSAIEQEAIVEGIDHEISDLHWVTTLRLSPNVAEEAGGFWQIGVPGRSEIGVTTRVYF